MDIFKMVDLIKTIKNRDWKAFERILSKIGDNLDNELGLNALMSSILLKENDFALELIKRNKTKRYMNKKVKIGENEYDATRLCIITKNYEVLMELLDTRVYMLKSVNGDGLSILDLSVLYGDLKIVKLCNEATKWSKQQKENSLVFANKRNRLQIEKIIL